MVFRGWGEGYEQAEHRTFLGQWNCTVWYNGEYMSYIWSHFGQKHVCTYMVWEEMEVILSEQRDYRWAGKGTYYFHTPLCVNYIYNLKHN